MWSLDARSGIPWNFGAQCGQIVSRADDDAVENVPLSTRQSDLT